jgi:hypothetical protein
VKDNKSAISKRAIQAALTEELPEMCSQIASGHPLDDTDLERMRQVADQTVSDLLEEAGASQHKDG